MHDSRMVHLQEQLVLARPRKRDCIVKPIFDIALASAMVLAGLSTNSMAAPVDISSGSAGFVSTPGGGGFADIYTFTLASAQTVNVLVSSVVGGSQDVDFSSLMLTGPSGMVAAAAFTADPYESWVISGAALAPGSYTLSATGNNSAAAGTYVGNIALSGSSPVPPGGGGGPLDLSSGSTGFVSTPAAGSFFDAYTFTLASPRAINVLLSSVVGSSQDVDFTSVTIAGPSGFFIAAELTGDLFENWFGSSSVLAPGSYTLNVAGTNSATVGTYVGSFALSEAGPALPNPVPEPSSFALVLAALGAAHATMRRRLARVGSVGLNRRVESSDN